MESSTRDCAARPAATVSRARPAMFFVKILFALALIPWTLAGLWLAVKFQSLFGPDRGHPSETPGERSFGITHVFAVWIGGMALGIYFVLVA